MGRSKVSLVQNDLPKIDRPFGAAVIVGKQHPGIAEDEVGGAHVVQRPVTVTPGGLCRRAVALKFLLLLQGRRLVEVYGPPGIGQRKSVGARITFDIGTVKAVPGRRDEGVRRVVRRQNPGAKLAILQQVIAQLFLGRFVQKSIMRVTVPAPLRFLPRLIGGLMQENADDIPVMQAAGFIGKNGRADVFEILALLLFREASFTWPANLGEVNRHVKTLGRQVDDLFEIGGIFAVTIDAHRVDIFHIGDQDGLVCGKIALAEGDHLAQMPRAELGLHQARERIHEPIILPGVQVDLAAKHTVLNVIIVLVSELPAQQPGFARVGRHKLS